MVLDIVGCEPAASSASWLAITADPAVHHPDRVPHHLHGAQGHRLMNLRVGPEPGAARPVPRTRWSHGLKVLTKRTSPRTAPTGSSSRWSPVVVFLAAVMTLLVVPVRARASSAQDLNIGLLYFFAVGGLSVVGLLMAGWSSFNKYSLLGGLRSAAQVISYEIPLTLSVVGLILLAGTMSLNHIVPDAVGLVHGLVRVPPAAGRRDLLHRRDGRGQPDAVRPDRGRLGDRGRLRHRVLGDALRLLLLRRVRQRVHHVGADRDALLRRLERAVPVAVAGHPVAGSGRPRASGLC